jgi:hypothetical protein
MKDIIKKLREPERRTSGRSPEKGQRCKYPSPSKQIVISLHHHQSQIANTSASVKGTEKRVTAEIQEVANL